jgi:hypothetical protein
VEWLNGAVARYGEKSKVATPINRVLTDTLLSLTTGEIPLAEFAHQPEKLLALIASKSGARHKGQSAEMQSFGEPHEQ